MQKTRIGVIYGKEKTNDGREFNAEIAYLYDDMSIENTGIEYVDKDDEIYKLTDKEKEEIIKIITNELGNKEVIEKIIEINKWCNKNQKAMSYFVYSETNYKGFKVTYANIKDLNSSTLKEFGKPLLEVTEEDVKVAKEKYLWECKGYSMSKDIVVLDNGERIIKDYGKYRSDLIILTDSVNKFEWKNANLTHMNISFNGETKVLIGDYFLSKKGNKCFRINENGQDILIKISWGGAFNESRGLCDNPPNHKYYKRKRSNNGRLGSDYLIVPINFKNTVCANDYI